MEGSGPPVLEYARGATRVPRWLRGVAGIVVIAAMVAGDFQMWRWDSSIVGCGPVISTQGDYYGGVITYLVVSQMTVTPHPTTYNHSIYWGNVAILASASLVSLAASAA